MTHYELLQVSESASVEIIHIAWRALIREVHPDGPKPDEALARKLNHAHDILSDPKKREAYDAELGAARFARHQRTGTGSSNVPPVDFTGWNPSAYPDAYQDLANTIPEVMNEFGRNVAMDVGNNLLNQVLQNMHPSLRGHFANAIKNARKAR